MDFMSTHIKRPVIISSASIRSAPLKPETVCTLVVVAPFDLTIASSLLVITAHADVLL